MLKVDRIEVPNFKRIISPSLLSVKDYSVFMENSTNKYYTVPIKYLTKLYKSIGLKDYQFVKTLYEVKKEFMIALVQDGISTKLNYNIFKLQDSDEMLFLSSAVFPNIKYLINELNTMNIKDDKMSIFNNIYLYHSKMHSKIIFLLFNNNEPDRNGVYIKLSMIDEIAHLYSLIIKEDKMLLMNKYSDISLNDERFRQEYKQYLEMYKYNSEAVYSMYPENLEDIKLSWTELSKAYKILKRDPTEEENHIMYDLNPFRLQFEFSSRSLKDLFTFIYADLNKSNLNYFEPFYDNALDGNYVYFKLR